MQEIYIEELLEEFESDRYSLNLNYIKYFNKNFKLISNEEIGGLRLIGEYNGILDLSQVKCKILNFNNFSVKDYILPNSLKELYCNNSEIKELPKLPNSLEILFCSCCKLTSLPKLPNSLKKLNCSYNQLTSLLDLPDSLEELNCSDNQLTFLPDLPDSLEELNCSDNQLKSLPNYLPNSLYELICSNNQLTSFANTQLPDSLEILDFSNNQLTSFANTQLPNSLRSLYCCNNDIKNIITLPNCLYRLNFKQKNDIYLKNLPISLKIIICNTMHVEIIEYNENAKDIYNLDTKIYCGDDIITCKNDLEKYMEKLKINKIKSAK